MANVMIILNKNQFGEIDLSLNFPTIFDPDLLKRLNYSIIVNLVVKGVIFLAEF